MNKDKKLAKAQARKFRKYRAKVLAEKGIDFYAQESAARKNTAQRSKVKKLLRRRKTADKAFKVLPVAHTTAHGKALARAGKNKRKLSHDYKHGKVVTISVTYKKN